MNISVMGSCLVGSCHFNNGKFISTHIVDIWETCSWSKIGKKLLY